MTCPLCASDAPLSSFPVPGGPVDASADVCATCAAQIDGTPEDAHWRGLTSSMWSEGAAG
ncbi:PhnA Zinc-Ribbon [Aliiroseovarius halocynthiae]|uniref:Uncharacterized protein n=1 Tax=Aliiroseovarius halocynthiae TaxID=985055 RepID=A0A545SYD7_9RHOB|nr:hypothetical protein [Aliiroseovarius halocynthiae]TQV69977.1 hypothetical protein FIL88_00980 [Aliiroseovarius halocynthiae]SMR70642.1 PhnA Zinc-Ribbon [Aliiroseovarius halocynthiae]